MPQEDQIKWSQIFRRFLRGANVTVLEANWVVEQKRLWPRIVALLEYAERKLELNRAATPS